MPHQKRTVQNCHQGTFRRACTQSFGFRGAYPQAPVIVKAVCKGVRQMSNPINFQGDAMECLRMAEQAKGQEERAVLVDLARAWVLLGEQLNHLNQENTPDLAKPSPLN